MGIHHWTGYVEYEFRCLENFIKLIEDFCMGCHTSEDVDGCERCKVGTLLTTFKKYLLEAYESDSLKEETKIIRKIKKAIKPISWSPMFGLSVRGLNPALLRLAHIAPKEKPRMKDKWDRLLRCYEEFKKYEEKRNQKLDDLLKKMRTRLKTKR